MKRIKYLGISEPVLTPRATISGRVSLKSHIFGNLRDGGLGRAFDPRLVHVGDAKPLGEVVGER